MGVSERKLSAGGRRVDHDALRRLAETYAPALLVYCCRKLRDVHLAEDAVQEAFCRAVRLAPSRRVDHLPGWLFGVARRCCQEIARKRRRRAAMPAHLKGLSAERDMPRTDAAERAERLHRALERLGDAERSLIYMKHTRGLKCREIAEATGMPLGTVTAALSRAYARLRRAWQEQEA